jgi:Family of unknown function (DUF5677)
LFDEDRLREHIRVGLATELQVASDLLSVGTGLFNKNLSIDTDDVPGHDEIWLCLGVTAKACRQYRAIVAMDELGLGDVANSNCRMLVETSLAAQFLMRPEVKLRQSKKDVAEIPGYPLTTEFRTKLYLANDALTTAKALREMAKDGDLGSEDDDEILGRAEQHAKEQCDPIGPEWTKRLKDSGSFSGLKIVDLAESFDRLPVYNAFYRPASAGVHGADARKSMNLEIEDGGAISFRFPISPEDVADALLLASHALLDVLQVASIRFGLGLEERTKNLRVRVRQMKQQLT